MVWNCHVLHERDDFGTSYDYDDDDYIIIIIIMINNNKNNYKQLKLEFKLTQVIDNKLDC